MHRDDLDISYELFRRLINDCLERGAYRASVVNVSDVVFDKAFRDMCEANSCGMYGKCYMCPPGVGDIDVLIKEARTYKYALVYQTVSKLDDSFDFEGMIAAKKKTYPLAQSLRKVFSAPVFKRVLHLCAGGCGVCEKCAKITNEPCRYPDLCMPSLEAYGVNVSELSKAADMKYINGQNTVTYFGAVLFDIDE